MLNHIEHGQHELICQKWREMERGWGHRPDGFSLHLSFDSLKLFISNYWDGMPRSAPDIYEAPDGTPYIVGVGRSVYEEVASSDNGKRYYTDFEYPGSGGIDGWMPYDPDGGFHG